MPLLFPKMEWDTCNGTAQKGKWDTLNGTGGVIAKHGFISLWCSALCNEHNCYFYVFHLVSLCFRNGRSRAFGMKNRLPILQIQSLLVNFCMSQRSQRLIRQLSKKEVGVHVWKRLGLLSLVLWFLALEIIIRLRVLIGVENLIKPFFI